MSSQPVEEAVYAFLKSYISEKQCSPSYREIAAATGYSTRTVYLAVGRLEERGLVVSEPNTHRTLRIS